MYDTLLVIQNIKNFKIQYLGILKNSKFKNQNFNKICIIEEKNGRDHF